MAGNFGPARGPSSSEKGQMLAGSSTTFEDSGWGDCEATSPPF